jgi:tetratricopeptide (TPR) repeat protein
VKLTAESEHELNNIEFISTMKSYITIISVLIFSHTAEAQSQHKQLREGDLMYSQGEYLSAEEAYRKANAREQNAQAQYNLGNAIYQQERYDEAVQHFEAAAQGAKDPLIKSRAYHNLGNTHFRAEALDKSVEAYINALKLNPDDLDTKKNLTMALQKIEQQQQQQQQQSRRLPICSNQASDLGGWARFQS